MSPAISEMLQYVILIGNAPIIAACLVFLWRLDRRVFLIEVKLGLFPNRREQGA